MAFYDHAQHHGDTGHALFDLSIQGRRTQAAQRLAYSVAHHAPAFARSRAISRTKLASLLMATGDPRQAAAIGQKALASGHRRPLGTAPARWTAPGHPRSRGTTRAHYRDAGHPVTAAVEAVLVEACTRVGLDATHVELIRAGENMLYWLAGSVVARVTR